MKTTEEKKEANRIAVAKYRAKNQDKIKEYQLKNKAKLKENKVKYDHNMRTHFVVYTHTNSEGAIYVGCGHNLRPYQFSGRNRSKAWHKTFDNDCEIKIVAEFKDKESALELESKMINEIGLDNLINTRK